MKHYKSANEYLYELILMKGCVLPHLSPEEEAMFQAVSNEVTVTAMRLNGATGLERLFMGATKRKYKECSQELIDILSFWGIPRSLIDKTIIVSYANA